MMRRASKHVALIGALLGLAVLGIPAVASAKPTVKAQAKIVPIPKHLNKKKSPNWPNTGNILGAPAALEFKFQISGHEYPKQGEPGITSKEWEYGPAPLRQVVVYLPKGTKVNAKGFPTCSESFFARQEPEKCPKGSLASPPGEADGKVVFGGTIVKEKVTVQAYFAGANKLIFYVEGKAPAQIETFASGQLKPFSGGPFGLREQTEVPLISTVTGAPYAIAESIDVKIGAAMKKGKKLLSYGTVPKKCPKGGFAGKSEMFFGPGAESSWEETTSEVKVPCPKRVLVKGKAHKASKSHHNKGHKGKHLAKGHGKHHGKGKKKGHNGKK